MTLEELVDCSSNTDVESVSEALEELLVAAREQDCLTMGVYESAKLMNADPDSVVLCVLACDEEDGCDVAMQIHFTLIRAFCCEARVDLLRVSGMRRLRNVLGEPGERDLHCILVTSPQAEHMELGAVGRFCEESRTKNQWLPCVTLTDR
ncbi:growth arrest and DNA-damage-inducible, beta b [Astyanax mexicanus]|uniref:Growth arrest and DNA damage-inducible protein GADD45 beta-like n=2 Tax=Astyanax mexicanus TaxID=7994 RepID=A0A8B9RJ05_ASTMX|nr:growth arrest and DNA-damage-inducible, beta b [Astyanax mexicanus]KAG9273933.1 growth arrest and DNA damage-inducible protein GADD45 beta-like [Astyanax mexicanus]